jgi:hypothetical protein
MLEKGDTAMAKRILIVALCALSVGAVAWAFTGPPVCIDAGGDMVCSHGGFKSQAGRFYGSGAVDFSCDDNFYCTYESQLPAEYVGNHGAHSFTSKHAMGPGTWLYEHLNPYFPAMQSTVYGDHRGNHYMPHGEGFIGQYNGAGMRNLWSYSGISGASTAPSIIGDVAMWAKVTHRNGGAILDLWGWGPQFQSMGVHRFLDRGEHCQDGQCFKHAVVGTSLRTTHYLSDGGTLYYDQAPSGYGSLAQLQMMEDWQAFMFVERLRQPARPPVYDEPPPRVDLPDGGVLTNCKPPLCKPRGK